MDINNTNFPIVMREFIKSILVKDGDWLKPAQRIVHDSYMHMDTEGVLLYWKMGAGKTREAVSLALSASQKKIIVLLYKSLVPDFTSKMSKIRDAIAKRDDVTDEERARLDAFNFVSLNASNVIDQLERVTHSTSSKKSFDDSVVIVDEAHHFFNSITNGSKNALALYGNIMKAKNCRKVFLSGTPITKDIWEMVPCFNMLAGYELLPEDRDDFYKLFGEGRNRAKLENRLFGLISHYELPPSLAKIHLPERHPTKIVKVLLTNHQLPNYMLARDLEMAESSRSNQKGLNLKTFAAQGNTKMISSYRSKSRQFSNIVGPKHCYVKDEEGKEKFDPSLLTDEDCANMATYSPKLVAMWDNIEKLNKQFGNECKQFCYSQYKKAGVLLFKRYAEYKGLIDEFEGGSSKKGTLSFGVMHGGIPTDQRSKCVDSFNEVSSGLNLLFVTVTGSEGFDFKGSRAAHIFEYFWHDNIIQQVIARGDRMDSHSHLDPKDRTIQPFVYLAVLPQEAKKFKDPKKDVEGLDQSTDEHIYEVAQTRKEEIDEMLELYKRVSINCTANCDELGVKCKVCSPTNQKLYFEKLADDLELPDPCVAPKEEKVKVSELLYDGVTYYYDSKKRVLIFDKALNSYVYMNINNPLYHILYNMIKDK